MYSLKEKVIQFLYIDYSKNPGIASVFPFIPEQEILEISKEPSVPSIGCCVVVETFVTFCEQDSIA